MKKITILKKFALLCVLLPISFSLPSCSNSDDDTKTPTNEKGSGSTGGEKGPSLTEEETTTINGIDVPVSDKDKSSANLISEAYTALNAGDYNKTLSKFRSAYAKEQTDETKIYYALTELALLSTDKTVADIIKNDLGITDYPATPNAIFNTSWFKNYPKYESISADRFEKNSTGSYIRVSATPTDSYSSSNLFPWNAYALYDGDWVEYYAYSSMMKEGYYLSNIVPDSNGKYLIPFNDYYDRLNTSSQRTSVENQITDYLYNSSGTKTSSGSYVRLAGTETSSYEGNYVYISYKNFEGIWSSSNKNLIDYSLSNEGNYLVYKSYFISGYIKKLLKSEYSDYLYNMISKESYKKSLLGKAVYVPELAIPEWVKSTDYYQDSLVKTTQTYKTWLYLLYANVVTKCDNGFNNTIDKLLSVIHSKTETIKAIVDSLGTGTATLDAEFIANLKLTKILGEDPVDFGKPEMNVLTAALEACDAVLNFAASYDFSANLKAAEVDFDSDFYVKRDADKILNIVNDCVTSSTLSVRDASKLTTSKTLLSSALTRLISTYNDIKNSNNYPQAAKDKIDEYGPFLLDGATKAKAALNNGTVFYLPQNPKANTFPTSASDAAFGIDFGKIFTPGYFTDIIKRSSDKEKIKIYYKRYEDSYSYSSENGYKTVKSESDPTEIETTIEEFVKTIASDAENSGYSDSSSSGSYSYGRTRIWYDIGIMADRDIITNALTGIANTQRNSAIVDKMRFIKLFTINSIK
ncbi:MAG: hypothetical protein IJP61_12100 [Treponema sp.]|nr:hypothetical protein [Treponema sp.]